MFANKPLKLSLGHPSAIELLLALHLMAEAVKQLKIKTGSVGRLSKELLLYQEEELQEQKKVSQLKAGGADQHDIKHAVSCTC